MPLAKVRLMARRPSSRRSAELSPLRVQSKHAGGGHSFRPTESRERAPRASAGPGSSSFISPPPSSRSPLSSAPAERQGRREWSPTPLSAGSGTGSPRPGARRSGNGIGDDPRWLTRRVGTEKHPEQGPDRNDPCGWPRADSPRSNARDFDIGFAGSGRMARPSQARARVPGAHAGTRPKSRPGMVDGYRDAPAAMASAARTARSGRAPSRGWRSSRTCCRPHRPPYRGTGPSTLEARPSSLPQTSRLSSQLGERDGAPGRTSH